MRALPLAFAAVTVLGAGPARAQSPASGPRLFGSDETPAPPLVPEAPRAVRLDYIRGPGAEPCPPAEVFRDALGARMRFDPFDPNATARLVVTVVREGRRFRGAAEIRHEGSVRGWFDALGPSADCNALMDALAVSVAVELDKSSSTPPSPGEGSPPKEPTKGQPTSPPRSFLVRLGAAASLSVGSAPGVAFGVTADAGLRWSWASVALEGRADFPASAEVKGLRLTSSRYAGALVPCGHWGGRWGSLFGCALVELGALRLTNDAPHPTPASGFYAAAGARGGVEVVLVNHLAARLTADALGTFQRSTLIVDGRPVWTTPAASGAFGLGLVTFF